jgi:hypothetical protein
LGGLWVKSTSPYQTKLSVSFACFHYALPAMILDGDVGNPFVLNDYYQTNTNDFTKGTYCGFL